MSDTQTLDPEVETQTDGDGGDVTVAEPTVAPAEDEPSGEKKTVASGADRQPRGWLESDVKRITDKYAAGELKIEDDKPLTPHRLANLVQSEGDLLNTPSTGAVAAVLKRWVELDFAVCSEGPFAFVGYTEAGIEHGLTALKERRGEARKAERAAAKEAAAPAVAEVEAPAEA